MFGLFSGFYSEITKPVEKKILLVGSLSSGKSVILKNNQDHFKPNKETIR